MDSRTFYKFWGTKAGKTLMALALIVIILGFIYVVSGNDAEVKGRAISLAESFQSDATEAVNTIETNVQKVYTPRPQAQPEPERQQSRAKPNPVPATIKIFEFDSPGYSATSAQFGTMIEAQLVTTVDSNNLDTPIVGTILRDVYNHSGDLIIAAGNEIYGTAQNGRVRNAIGASGTFTLVWTDGTGRELNLKGALLHRERNHRGSSTFTIDDMSSGLKGDVITTTDNMQLKLIAASVIQGLAQGLSDRTVTTTGSSTTVDFNGDIQNALARGVEQAATVYAQQMLQAINRDGFYVRVPAGQTFYVMSKEPIDPTRAFLGASIQNNSQ